MICKARIVPGRANYERDVLVTEHISGSEELIGYPEEQVCTSQCNVQTSVN